MSLCKGSWSSENPLGKASKTVHVQLTNGSEAPLCTAINCKCMHAMQQAKRPGKHKKQNLAMQLIKATARRCKKPCIKRVSLCMQMQNTMHKGNHEANVAVHATIMKYCCAEQAKNANKQSDTMCKHKAKSRCAIGATDRRCAKCMHASGADVALHEVAEHNA